MDINGGPEPCLRRTSANRRTSSDAAEPSAKVAKEQRSGSSRLRMFLLSSRLVDFGSQDLEISSFGGLEHPAAATVHRPILV